MDTFDKVLLAEKAGLILMLILFAFVNKHNQYISKSPRRFMADNLVSGFTGAAAFYAIAQMRGSPNGVSIAVTTFLLLFMLNVLMELAGLNDPEDLTQAESKEVKVLKWPAAVIAVLGLLALLVLAAMNNVPGPESLPKEALLFGVASGLSAMFVGFDHGGSVETTLGTSAAATAFFGVLHVVLQKGGFYQLVF